MLYVYNIYIILHFFEFKYTGGFAVIAHANICNDLHDDVIKWKHFPRYWPFVRGIHRSPVNSLHKGQWRIALVFSLIFAWTNGGVNNRDAGDLRSHRTHYDVTVMDYQKWKYSETILPLKLNCGGKKGVHEMGFSFDNIFYQNVMINDMCVGKTVCKFVIPRYQYHWWLAI